MHNLQILRVITLSSFLSVVFVWFFFSVSHSLVYPSFYLVLHELSG
jgi:hypothetical protein